jgi:hypothetical protein
MPNIGTTSSPEVHHQQHRSQSGDDSARNLITLCAAWHKNVHRGAWRSYITVTFRWPSGRLGFCFLALGLRQHCREPNRFGLSGGQHWDALACVENWTGGVWSVESKSHVPEIFGNGCGARAASSVKKIEQAIAAAKHMVAFQRTGRLETESAGSCGCHLSTGRRIRKDHGLHKSILRVASSVATTEK